jgi:hypothetical protein
VAFREHWDLVVSLTDLPHRSGLRTAVAEASVTDGVALASLPALGARRLYQRVREMVIGLTAAPLGPSGCRARGRLATVPEGTSQVPGSRSIRRRTAGPLAKERP